MPLSVANPAKLALRNGLVRPRGWIELTLRYPDSLVLNVKECLFKSGKWHRCNPRFAGYLLLSSFRLSEQLFAPRPADYWAAYRSRKEGLRNPTPPFDAPSISTPLVRSAEFGHWPWFFSFRSLFGFPRRPVTGPPSQTNRHRVGIRSGPGIFIPRIRAAIPSRRMRLTGKTMLYIEKAFP